MSSFYIVFGSIKRPSDFFGGKVLDWSQPPIGVYEAESPEDACQAAARDHGQMATYFAVHGTPWGVDLIEAPARQLGKTENSQDRMNRLLDRMDKNDQLIEELRKQPHRELTPVERVAAAEARSDELDREEHLGPYADDSAA